MNNVCMPLCTVVVQSSTLCLCLAPLSLSSVIPTCWFMLWRCINSPRHCDDEFTISPASLGNNCHCLDCCAGCLQFIFNPVVIYLGARFLGAGSSLLSWNTHFYSQVGRVRVHMVPCVSTKYSTCSAFTGFLDVSFPNWKVVFSLCVDSTNKMCWFFCSEHWFSSICTATKRVKCGGFKVL